MLSWFLRIFLDPVHPAEERSYSDARQRISFEISKIALDSPLKLSRWMSTWRCSGGRRLSLEGRVRRRATLPCLRRVRPFVHLLVICQQARLELVGPITMYGSSRRAGRSPAPQPSPSSGRSQLSVTCVPGVFRVRGIFCCLRPVFSPPLCRGERLARPSGAAGRPRAASRAPRLPAACGSLPGVSVSLGPGWQPAVSSNFTDR